VKQQILQRGERTYIYRRRTLHAVAMFLQTSPMRSGAV